jgi:site-specific DNA-adenine methylase
MVYIPFCGGCSEVPWIDAKQILCNDLHRHIINLCAVVANDEFRAKLIKDADEMPYHPDILGLAQKQAACYSSFGSEPFATPNYDAALSYFVAVWMGRGGKAGTASEFNGNLPIRWNSSGGGSNRRYRTAIEALDSWGEAFRRCEFTCMDAFEFLSKCQDEPLHGVYVDVNWPDLGDGYLHSLDEAGQRRLASRLNLFCRARVVVRFGEHPLIRELYPDSVWTWRPMASRNQANDVNAEFLITKNL